MKKIIFLFVYVFTLFLENTNAQRVAFPGAEGAGKFASGGRGGKVLFVTNLEDSGEGSLRSAIEKKFPRIIIFKVSGTIFLKSPLEIEHGNVTIAGQTAPGDGICIAGYPVIIQADNVIIRFLRFRLGDINKIPEDALKAKKSKNIIIDHCTMSWAVDENASLYNIDSSTVQWCIISEALNSSFHPKGEHGYGGIWGGHIVTFHHNLFAHNVSRNPRFNGNRLGENDEFVDFINNVIYNWGSNSIYGGEGGRYNLINNYFKAGPATNKSVRRRIVEISKSENFNYGTFYIEGNYVEGYPEISLNNWKGGVDIDDSSYFNKVRSLKPFKIVDIKVQNAQEAYKYVLKYAGCSLIRDEIDKRIIEEVKTGTAKFGKTYKGGGKGIIDSQDDVGGWPVLKTKEYPVDSDNDGIPDDWEKKHGLNPFDGKDYNLYSLDKNYTNLEVYINSLVPIEFYKY